MAGASSNIPTEIRSDEGIVSMEAALASAASSPVISAAIPAIQSPTPASKLQGNAISVQLDSAQTKRRLFTCAEPDIEDYGKLLSTGKKSRADYYTSLGAGGACLSLMFQRQNGVKRNWGFLFSSRIGRTMNLSLIKFAAKSR